MSYSSERNRNIKHEHRKLLQQGADPDAAHIVARELVRGDEDKAKRRSGRKVGKRTKVKMSFSKRNVDDVPVPDNDVRFY